MGFLSGVGEFLFGSNPGRKSGKALEQFGLTGGGEVGNSLANDANEAVQLLGASQRQASSQRLARSGLTGSGIAEDRLGNIDLTQADALNQLRMAIIRQRLRALGIAAQQPREPGFVESVGQIAAAKFLG